LKPDKDRKAVDFSKLMPSILMLIPILGFWKDAIAEMDFPMPMKKVS